MGKKLELWKFLVYVGVPLGVVGIFTAPQMTEWIIKDVSFFHLSPFFFHSGVEWKGTNI